VPDAYVTQVDGQRRIQLASLESLQQAQQMVNELKNQGFPAAIMAQN
jgi:cell division septation protein DedD